MILRRPPSYYLKRFIGVGFLLFLIKGLLWLLIPALIAIFMR